MIAGSTDAAREKGPRCHRPARDSQPTVEVSAGQFAVTDPQLADEPLRDDVLSSSLGVAKVGLAEDAFFRDR